MVVSMLENILTKVQFNKINDLFERYPQLLDGEEVVSSSSEISEALNIKSDKVYRDLFRIGELTGRLKITPVYVDDWDKTKVVDDPFGHEEVSIQRGGRGKSRYFRITWKVYTTGAKT